jgi:hypothetical protein
MQFEFNTRQFQFSHGRQPKGFGSWAFEVEGSKWGILFTPHSMSFADAKKWIKGEVKTRLGSHADNVPAVSVTVCP